MWRTPEGERALHGAEWELFREGLCLVVDFVEDSVQEPELASFGVEAFDQLEPNQKLALLCLVGKALQSDNEPPPNLTAHTEATVAAVFQAILSAIEMEIDNSRHLKPAEVETSWRRSVLSAYSEVADESGTRMPGPSEEDVEEWDLLLLVLSDRILWDDDYELASELMDVDPEQSRRIKKMARIEDEYFTAIPPDPTDEELVSIRRTLREVCGPRRS